MCIQGHYQQSRKATQCFEMISNGYLLAKIQTLGRRCLRILLPTLPCCSNVASTFSFCALSLQHGSWQEGNVLPGQKSLNVETDSWSVKHSRTDFDQKGEMWKKVKETPFVMKLGNHEGAVLTHTHLVQPKSQQEEGRPLPAPATTH